MEESEPRLTARRAPLPRYTRAILVLMALAFITVFALAAWIEPYGLDGAPQTMRTHTQLGLPRCSMEATIGKPCPACGMTTSFALLTHGDPVNSLKANWVGTLLALLWLALIPWGLISAIRARLWGIRNGELMTTILVGVMLTLMLLRWIAVLLT